MKKTLWRTLYRSMCCALRALVAAEGSRRGAGLRSSFHIVFPLIVFHFPAHRFSSFLAHRFSFCCSSFHIVFVSSFFIFCSSFLIVFVLIVFHSPLIVSHRLRSHRFSFPAHRFSSFSSHRFRFFGTMRHFGCNIPQSRCRLS